MKAPSLLSRICGKPAVAMVLVLLCGALLIGCYHDQVPWLLGAVAVMAALHAVKSVGQIRRYNAWAVKWRAVTEEIEPQQSEPQAMPQKQPVVRKEKNRRGWRVCRFVLGALLLAVAYPFDLKSPESPALLAGPPAPVPPETTAARCIWCALCGVYVWRLSRRGVKKAALPVALAVSNESEQAGPDVVTRVVPLPSSSPSRELATRELPEYCLRLMGAPPL